MAFCGDILIRGGLFSPV